ncbi:type II secretion system protein GspD [uncultured Shewanella sp.]|uniref:type II secretion system protein GspD n=1 Tax=uncultured Shewanella sp. TaxID=173975 RepID=UPI003704071A
MKTKVEILNMPDKTAETRLNIQRFWLQAKVVMLVSGSIMFVNGCTNIQQGDTRPAKKLESSYLVSAHVDGKPVSNTNVSNQKQLNDQNAGTSLTRVPSLVKNKVGFSNDEAIADSFSVQPSITIAADNMPLNDFLHYAFGELLQTSYVLGQHLVDDSNSVTLNLQEKISPQKLFSLVEQLLLQRNIGVKKQNDVLYIHKQSAESGQVTAVGYGRSVDSVPNATNVQQIVPLRYLINTNSLATLRDITGVATAADVSQGVLFLTGRRDQVIRSLELLALLDSPGSLSRNIGFLKLMYVDTDTFIKAITEILQNEGIMGDGGSRDNRISLVPISQLGAVAVFASEADFINRVEFWAKQIDKPSRGNEKQYFVYTPQFARASDLGQSVSALISGRSVSGQQAEKSSIDKAAAIENTPANSSKISSASNDEINMVVDERSNALIFYTSGPEYQAILPLVSRLDVMPKQVVLEVSIAEVTLTDEFKFGVDMAFSSGNFTLSNAYGAADIGSSVLKWASGVNSIDAQAFESNKWVNVLSKPSLLVRDGVSATIQVGTDIPVVGKTTTDPTNGVTKSVEYRKTGIELTVTPTINAQGVVIMTINQSNSNEVDGGTDVEGNPQIFERSISTEVVAESGQTVILGGLISENSNDNNSGLPWLSKIPVIGSLFGTTTKSKVKTELVIMVTPKVIQRSDEWEAVKEQFSKGLQFIEL